MIGAKILNGDGQIASPNPQPMHYIGHTELKRGRRRTKTHFSFKILLLGVISRTIELLNLSGIKSHFLDDVHAQLSLFNSI